MRIADKPHDTSEGAVVAERPGIHTVVKLAADHQSSHSEGRGIRIG